MFKIGALTISSSCLLSPLAGISDLPFRLVNRRFGCAFAFTEMVSARALVYQNRLTFNKMLATVSADRPLGVQLVGSDPAVLQRALDIISCFAFDLIDFNAACPVSKVTGKGEGASLLNEPKKLSNLLKIIVAKASVPVTVKIRSGWDSSSVNARDVALYAQDAGVHGVIIHGRTREQGYSGTVDYRSVREVKNALDIPVVASGDALSPRLIKKMLDETGCDGVAIARGALGNPWIFRGIAEFLQNGIQPIKPGIDELADTMLYHLHLCLDFHGEWMGPILYRKFFNWYTRGLYGIKGLREIAFQAKTREQMVAVINDVRKTYWDPGLPNDGDFGLGNATC